MLGSLSAFARHLKVNKAHAWRLKEKGRLVLVEQGGKTLVDFEQSAALIAATADPDKDYMAEVNAAQRAAHGRESAVQAPAPSEQISFKSMQMPLTKAKAEDKQLDVQIKRIEYQKLIGEVAEVAPMVSAMLNCVGTATAALDGLADRLTPQVVGEMDARKVYDVIRAETIRMREELQRSTQALIASRKVEQPA